jgi:hypothetical protein
MNATHIETALGKEFLSRRRRLWWWPLALTLTPAAIALLVTIATGLARLVGAPVGTEFSAIDFHALHGITGQSLTVLNLWLLVVTVLYLTRPLHRRHGGGEALFWRSVGLGSSELVTVRILLVALVLPVVTAILTLVVVLSLGAVDLVGLLATGGPFLSSAASLAAEIPTLGLLVLAALLFQSLWLLPVTAALLVCSGLARRERGPASHPLVLAFLSWIGLTILGNYVRPLGRWLSLLGRNDPVSSVFRLEADAVHLPMLVFNVVLGLALLALAARLDARPSA